MNWNQLHHWFWHFPYQFCTITIFTRMPRVWEVPGGHWTSTTEAFSTFLFRNFTLLAAFRLRVEGLDFFFLLGKAAADSLASMEKVKVEPRVTVKEKALPWLGCQRQLIFRSHTRHLFWRISELWNFWSKGHLLSLQLSSDLDFFEGSWSLGRDSEARFGQYF